MATTPSIEFIEGGLQSLSNEGAHSNHSDLHHKLQMLKAS
ncbi:hypothetical protein JCM19241_952 [Vibrio ishigakensis]|uniref:Uncharacterized protein n=1 Tax=Vibrio ishigakensis TaxID=1481914 RepID=A0A0B8QJ68_9VIBR|nr:hypothetical protein JCM19241_952 [Vibrio ishigakensis]